MHSWSQIPHCPTLILENKTVNTSVLGASEEQKRKHFRSKYGFQWRDRRLPTPCYKKRPDLDFLKTFKNKTTDWASRAPFALWVFFEIYLNNFNLLDWISKSLIIKKRIYNEITFSLSSRLRNPAGQRQSGKMMHPSPWIVIKMPAWVYFSAVNKIPVIHTI